MPLSQQAQLLSLSRASLYYQARPIGGREVATKHRMDQLYTEHPFLGSRKVALILTQEGLPVSRHTIRRYRAQMGLETLYPKPRLLVPGEHNQEQAIYPYLLRGLSIERPNQVWGIDITYIRLRAGWMYLVAILDWFSGYVLAWELDQSLEIGFVLSCAQAALDQAVPEILNSDQGSHFTSKRFSEPFLSAGAQISMDGRGRCMDNIFTERLWRSVKYEEVYLTEYETPREARGGLARYLSFYNEGRPHQALGYRTPAQVYRQGSASQPQSFLINGPQLS
jgi:putative transposase